MRLPDIVKHDDIRGTDQGTEQILHNNGCGQRQDLTVKIIPAVHLLSVFLQYVFDPHPGKYEFAEIKGSVPEAYL